MAGKGDKIRKGADLNKFRNNYDQIFGNKDNHSKEAKKSSK